MTMKLLKRQVAGFTFIELMMTLVILAVLLLMAVPLAQYSVQREKERALRTALIELREALDAYKRASDQGRISLSIGDSGYPKSLSELVEGVPDQRSPIKQKIYFLRSLPADPMNPNVTLHADETWGLRSYASSADEPEEGVDIFDVYSLSEKKGLNGVPYLKW